MIPATSQRVPQQTADAINRRIQQEMEERVASYEGASREAISRRLHELDQEWDIERSLEANAATACLIGVTLGATVHRRWFYFPAFVGGFLLQHAIQGWCPPVPVFRRLGFRTAAEIAQERYALKALRGDFDRLAEGVGGAEQVLAAVQR